MTQPVSVAAAPATTVRRDAGTVSDGADAPTGAFAAVSYGALVWWKFRRNRPALAAGIFLVLLYAWLLPAEFTAPYSAEARDRLFLGAPPQPLTLVRCGPLPFPCRPAVYALRQDRDPVTLRRRYSVDRTQVTPLRLFPRGEPYRLPLLGITVDRHLFGVERGTMYLLGTDAQGRDVVSRIIHGGRVSMTVGLVGVTISMALGMIVGAASGLFGGWVDDVIQRLIEALLSIPTIPLWLALSAAIPHDWAPLQIFLGITVVLSVIGWGSLARVVRGMTLSLKTEEFVLASRMNGATVWWILTQHLLPANLSYLIVAATLAVPGMILGETALSFLGLGVRAPMVSWGVLLREAQDVTVLAQQPWLVLPVVWVIASVLAFNFLGDGLRDAVDPFSQR